MSIFICLYLLPIIACIAVGRYHHNRKQTSLKWTFYGFSWVPLLNVPVAIIGLAGVIMS